MFTVIEYKDREKFFNLQKIFFKKKPHTTAMLLPKRVSLNMKRQQTL